MTTQEQLAETSLHSAHVAAGARMVPFAGWDMPIQYTSVIDEHVAVRTSAGMFDVSHMGQLRVGGADAERALDTVLSNDLARIPDPGMAQYTLLTNDHGGIEDDLIAYRMDDGSFLLVVNAANIDHDRAWISHHIDASLDAVVVDESNAWSMIAVQGPLAMDVVNEVLGVSLQATPAFRHIRHASTVADMVFCTTGYTGERGCEILLRPEDSVRVWSLLAKDDRIKLCGLAARDTLRLEACYPLHGNDITPTSSAIGAGLGWACPPGRSFPGAGLLDRERGEGPARRLVPLRMDGRGIPRGGCTVLDAAGERVGVVSSGTMSPTLRSGIALAWLDDSHAGHGTRVQIDVRGSAYDAHVVSRPFIHKTDEEQS